MADDAATDFDVVVAHELELLEPGVRDDPAAVRALLRDDFTEFGSSGQVLDHETITTATASDTSEPITATELRPVRLGYRRRPADLHGAPGQREDASQLGVGAERGRLAVAAPPGHSLSG